MDAVRPAGCITSGLTATLWWRTPISHIIKESTVSKVSLKGVPWIFTIQVSLDFVTHFELYPVTETTHSWSADCWLSVCCRIWSWSPMPCKKHGPRDSVDKNRGRRPRFLSLLRPEGHVFHTAWETMIKSYYSTLTDWFFPCFIHINMNLSALKWAIFGSLHGC